MKKQLSKLYILAISCQLLILGSSSAQTGKWSALKNLPPHPNMGVCLLMTDGTVICHDTAGGVYGTGWDRLTPDAHGSYINGTWDTIASMHNDRLFFSSQVLPSGKVYVAGGEYGIGGTAGEVYDPVTNTWTMCNNIPANWNIYDGNSEILPDGTVLEGPQISNDYGYSILRWSPITNNYTIESNSIYDHDEAEWLKLPDSSILFVGIATKNSNRYLTKTGGWVNDANVPGNLYDPFGEESGCALMLPNGKAVFFGATPYNAIYTPSGKATPGTWASADSFPKIQGTYMGQEDASGAMMVNGHILLAASPIGTSSNNEYNSPAYFLEYDYTTNKFTQVTDTIPGQGGDSISYIGAYQTQMLDLPDGTVLVSVSQTDTTIDQYYIYTPGSGPIAQGKPTINNVIPDGCSFYKITGKLFNGISEGAAFGDDWQMSTNYPLVRLTDASGDVYYCKTTNWNRIGAVQTDSLEDTAYFALPSVPGGTYSLVVTVNGFASNPVLFTTFGVGITSHTNVSPCSNGTNGSATAFASNGTAPYTYSWSPSGGTNATASNLSAGIYTVTVTSNGGGCSVTASVNILPPPVVGLSPKVEWVGCLGGDNGTASVSVTGGTTPYTYFWSGGAGSNAKITGLSAGTYTVTVLDSCGSSTSAALAVSPPPFVNLSPTKTNITCFGYSNGTASANANGGVSPYTYSWSGGAGSKATASGLSAGTYTITVADSCGSSVSSVVSITQPAIIAITTGSGMASSKTSCNGSAIANVKGGTAPYTYLWSPGGETTKNIINQCGGYYCCSVTDNNGCTTSACVDIGITGIENIIPNNKKIIISPNPNNGLFSIQSSISGEQSSLVEIYNVLGQKVYSQLATLIAPLSINISNQPNGIYLYRVIADNGELTGQGKLIIQK